MIPSSIRSYHLLEKEETEDKEGRKELFANQDPSRVCSLTETYLTLKGGLQGSMTLSWLHFHLLSFGSQDDCSCAAFAAGVFFFFFLIATFVLVGTSMTRDVVDDVLGRRSFVAPFNAGSV
ncbi:hypothetical protein CEXT_299771 [Caerostris extrusa]|uniref:Uncharacterized protein n=1 Tax=Caerostris extrusa TaxID=172846 RepID=A0AAV4V6V2_CAEEX|nr:hypothetical protein CEXT_299771 [Caerostris extrusa]